MENRQSKPRRQDRSQASAKFDRDCGVSGRSGVVWLSIVVLAALAAALAAASYARLVPIVVPAIYAVFSLSAFVAYAIDKSAARHGQWRTSEKTLHLLSLIGGWPGALLAQSVLRHKSKKRSFRVVFWLTVLANCSALGWMVFLRLGEAI